MDFGVTTHTAELVKTLKGNLQPHGVRQLRLLL
jgi:hypothetical protein